MSILGRISVWFHASPPEDRGPVESPSRLRWLERVGRLAPLVSCILLSGAAFSSALGAPQAANDTVDVDHNSSKTFSVLGNDDAGEYGFNFESVTIVTPPSHGSVDVEPMSGEIIYSTGDECFAGEDSFEYTFEDSEGNVSNAAVVTVHVAGGNPPQIVNFTVMESIGDVWFFEGRVIDEHPLGMTVTFGGIIEGHSTMVDDGGQFQLMVILDNEEEGYVSAKTEDCQGLESNLAQGSVDRF